MDKSQRKKLNINRPTHMKRDELQFAKEIADALTVTLEEADYWKEQSSVAKSVVDWGVQEKNLVERVAKFFHGNQKK